MKLLPAACALSLLACSAVATAQQPPAKKAQQPLTTTIDRPPVATLQRPLPATSHYSSPSLTVPAVTPELWVYSQEQRRHDDPAQAVRRKAEFQAEQRMSRLASLKWSGYSKSRPEINFISNPGTYTTGWYGSGWYGYGWPVGYPYAAGWVR
ncbi:MAG TPA: hypothetical protein VKH44_00845 [Pirellulaceae bacterium]|nr:hypothetical protein [Pirellulaceae bacterium]